MCGLAGIVTSDRTRPPQQLLERMCSVMSYRGPDDSGVYLSEGVTKLPIILAGVVALKSLAIIPACVDALVLCLLAIVIFRIKKLDLIEAVVT